MKKTVLALASVGLLGSANVMAMDLSKQAISNNGGNYISSFASSEYPPNGWFVQLNYGFGNFNNQNAPYSIGGINYSVNPNAKTSSINEMGLGIGYQNSAIQNSILRFLQVKRLAISLDALHNGAVTQNGVINIQNSSTRIFNYTTTVKSSNRIMVNGKVNILKVWHVSPYLEAGAGMGQYQANYAATNTANITYTNGIAKKTGFVYQTGAGLDWFVSKGLSVGAGYRVVNAGSLTLPSNAMPVPSTTSTINLPLKYNEWVVNLAYSF